MQTNPREEALRLINWELGIALESRGISRSTKARLVAKIARLISYWESKNKSLTN